VHHSQLDQRSLELHHRIAKKIRQQPALLDIVRHNIERFQAIVDPRSRPYLDAWQQALNQGMDALLALATEDSERATELRQSSPFPGVLSEPERLAFLSEWHRAHPDPERRPPQHFSPMTPHIPPPVILDRARARGVKISELLETSRQQLLAIAGLSLAYTDAPDIRIFLASERANYRLPDGVVIVGCQLPEKAVAIDVPTSIRALEVLAHGFHDQAIRASIRGNILFVPEEPSMDLLKLAGYRNTNG